MKCVQDVKFDIMDKIGKDLVEGGLFHYGPSRDTLIYIGDTGKLNAISANINRQYKEDVTQVGITGSEGAVLFIEPSDELANEYLSQYKNSNALSNRERFSLEQVERGYEIDNTGPNTDRFINLSPSEEEEGVFLKFVQHKQRLVSMLNNRLNSINSALKNPKLSVEDRTTLNNKRQAIRTRLEGDIHRGIKGINQEITDLMGITTSNIAAVGYYVEQDLNRLANIVNSDNAFDLDEAQIIIDFYNNAGTFQSGIDNPFFSQSEMFFFDEATGTQTPEYKLPPSVMEQFKQWRDIAMGYQPTLDLKEKGITTNSFNADKGVQSALGGDFKFDDIVHTKNGLKDIDWVSAWAMDVTQAIFSQAANLGQVMHSYLVNSLERNLNWSRDYAKRMEEMTPIINKRLGEIEGGKYKLKAFGIIGVNGVTYDLYLDKTPDGKDTGTLVQRFSLGFMEARRKAQNAFNTAFKLAMDQEDALKPALFNKAFVEHKLWRRANSVIMNPSLVQEIRELDEFSEFRTDATEEQIKQQRDELISILGERGYREQVEHQIEALNKYIADRDSYINSQILFEGVATAEELNEASKYAIKQWENQHSPMVGVEDYWSTEGIYMDGRKINNYMDYNSFIPRTNKVSVNTTGEKVVFTNTGDSTGFYNDKFKTIEADKILMDFYDLVKEGNDRIREVTPYDLQTKMGVNTLPMLQKSTAEFLLDNNNSILAMLSSAWRKLWERIRLSFGLVQQGDISYATKDPITGKYNYKINDQFLQGNSRAIKEREFLERTKFIQANKMSSKLGRYSTIEYKNLTPGAIAHLALMLNVDAAKVKSITGENVEIGRIIREFAVHSVVQAQSFDLPKLMKHFTNLAMAYAGRAEALPVLRIMKKHYDSIRDPRTTNIGMPIFNKLEDKIESEGGRELAVKQMEDWFQRVALDNYGIKHIGAFGKHNTIDESGDTKVHLIGRKIYSKEDRKKIREIDSLLKTEKDEDRIKELQRIKTGLGKVRTASAAMINFLDGVRTIGLGWNLNSAMTNMIEGYTSNMILASGGEYFDPAEIYYGISVARQGWTKNMTFGMRTTPNAKLARLLMDRYNILVDNKNDLQKASTKTNLSRVEALNPHEISSRVEYYNQVPIMIAMLRTMKIKDTEGNESSIWDAMNKDTGLLKAEFRSDENVSNWEKLTGDNYLQFKNKIGEAITKAHGNYDELRGMMAKSTLAGKALMMFKTWLPAQLYWRFANEQTNIKTGAKVKGRYRSFTKGTALVAGAALGAAVGGPIWVAVGGGLGLLGGGWFGIRTEMGALREMAEMTKALAKKSLGMPVNVIAGRNLCNITA